MTVKNVDYKQEPIENPFNFQWGLFLQMLVCEHRAKWEDSLGSLIRNPFSKIDDSIWLYIWNCLRWSIHFEIESRRKNNKMCLIQCIDCPFCIGLHLVPLKDDYFKGKNPKCFWFWPCKDLVYHFKNSDNFHTVVYDHICKNPGCRRRDPNYQPTHSSKHNGTCGSVYCQLKTCRLVISRFEGHCKNHHPRPDLLDKQAHQFRARLAWGDKKRSWRRKYFDEKWFIKRL